MNSESKKCQNCRKDFVIEPDDFLFYEKMKVPPPTWCPECRFQRRATYRNQMNLYSVKCGLCGKQTISMYAPGNSFPIYCQECWWSDKWDPLSYGKDYDFSKPFFEQYKELRNTTPRLALSNKNPVNSEYCNYAVNNKNCYLCFSIGDSEDCLYCGPNFIKSRHCINSSMLIESEQCYASLDCEKCYSLHYSQNSENCLNSSFLYNCRNCQNCLGCVNLRNKSYCIFNQPYSKEDYEKKVKEYNLGSYKKLMAFQKEFKDFTLSKIHKFMQSLNSTNVSGENIKNSKNCKWCFSSTSCENCKYSYTLNRAYDCYDTNGIYPTAEMSYESFSVVSSSRVKFNVAAISDCLDCEYTDSCTGVEHAFGCISLKKRQYCILNKQYAKEEYEGMVAKIKKHMGEVPYIDSKGRVYTYGEFFPPEFSPFGYNDTLAQEFFPLTKKQVKDQGWRWQEPVEKEVTITLRTEDMPDDIVSVGDDILEATIECAHKKQCNEQCTGAFKVTTSELAFYRHHSITLPRICVKCRAFERVRRRNPLKLWHRQCMCDYQSYSNTAKHSHHPQGPCPNEFETSYAPDRPEIVYCEACYQAEVV